MSDKPNEIEQSEMQIGAYLDNELNAEQRSMFEASLANDPDLKQRFEQRKHEWQLLNRALHQSDNAPMPTRVLDLLNDKQDNQTVVAFPRRNKGGMFAAAATVAFIGLLTVYLLSGGEQTGRGYTLASALNTLASGETVNLDENGNRQLLVNFSFLDTQGRYCREFYIVEQERALQRIACKGGEQWQTQIEDEVSFPSSSEFRPVSSQTSETIEAYLDTNMASDLLSKDAEWQAIQRQWQQ